MDDLLTVLAVLYVIGGAITYMLADTQPLASRIESLSSVITYGAANGFVFFAMMALWPAWWVFGDRFKPD
jgi:hypothetical protein